MASSAAIVAASLIKGFLAAVLLYAVTIYIARRRGAKRLFLPMLKDDPTPPRLFIVFWFLVMLVTPVMLVTVIERALSVPPPMGTWGKGSPVGDSLEEIAQAFMVYQRRVGDLTAIDPEHPDLPPLRVGDDPRRNGHWILGAEVPGYAYRITELTDRSFTVEAYLAAEDNTIYYLAQSNVQPRGTNVFFPQVVMKWIDTRLGQRKRHKYKALNTLHMPFLFALGITNLGLAITTIIWARRKRRWVKAIGKPVEVAGVG